MNFKKNWKRFWTLSRSNGGFTLVELIVVIAILAILAGVAVPAYSGYIKKANEAADNQLLAAVNTAFAAACLQNNTDASSFADGSVTATISGGKITNISEYYTDFQTYFAGNENAAFKVYESLDFKGGVFVGEEVATVSFTVNGTTYTLSQTAVDAFNASVFAQDPETVAEMQGQVNNLSAAFGALVKGEDGVSLNVSDLGEDFQKYIEDLGPDATATEIGNATVLYVAKNSAGMTAESFKGTLDGVANALNSGSSMDDAISGLMSGENALANSAALYGAITAYAYQTNNTDLINQAQNVNNGASLAKLFADGMSNTDFQKYCGYTVDDTGVVIGTASTEFNTNVNGYLGALEGITSSSDNLDLTDSNLWSGKDTTDLMNAILGASSN